MRAALGRLDEPIPSRLYCQSAWGPARALMVLLPGAGDRMGCFHDHGLVDTALRSPLEVDVLEVDAHFGYYRSLTLIERLVEDVLERWSGTYESIWLVGVSMGCMGALLTAERRPDAVSGCVLLSPYLGRRRLAREIDEAGGLTRWQPPEDAQVWRWDLASWTYLQRALLAPVPTDPMLHLVHGDTDLSPRAHALVTAHLAPSQVTSVAGEHEWSTWQRGFAELCYGGLREALAPTGLGAALREGPPMVVGQCTLPAS